MSDDFDADAIAHTLVSSWAFRSAVGQWAAGLDEQPTIERQIAAALRAAEARGLERAMDAARGCANDILPEAPISYYYGHKQAVVSVLAAIRGLSKPPD